MKILVIVAGTNEPSNSNILADAFIEGVRKIPDIEVTKFRLKDLSIDHFTLENYKKACLTKDDFCKIQEHIESSAGIVIASPIWNFSIPAHLKNLIDRMGAFALDEETHSKGQLSGKPFFVIHTGGAPAIAWKALIYLTTIHLSEAIKYYGGIVIGRHFEPRCMTGKGKFGVVVDQRPATLGRMRAQGEHFAGIAKAYAETGKMPFFARVRYQFFTFLYRVGNRIMYPISGKQ
ncbi:MAG: NAD(P)H-dependent oxidoreductase [Patescibacteria group bacterium]